MPSGRPAATLEKSDLDKEVADALGGLSIDQLREQSAAAKVPRGGGGGGEGLHNDGSASEDGGLPGTGVAPFRGFVQERRDVGVDELPFEFLMNVLRLSDGVAAELFAQRTGQPGEAGTDHHPARLAVATVGRPWRAGCAQVIPTTGGIIGR